MKVVPSKTLRHAFKLSRVAKWEWNKFNANITFIQICFYYLLTTGGDWVKQVKNKLASIICLTCQRRREGTYHIQTMHSCGHRTQLPGRLFISSDMSKKNYPTTFLHFLIGMGSFDHHAKYQGVFMGLLWNTFFIRVPPLNSFKFSSSKSETLMKKVFL